MKTIFLIMHDKSYTVRNGGKPLLAYERKEDADAMVDILKESVSGDLNVVEVRMQTAQPHTPLPIQPRVNQVPTSFGPARDGKEVA